MSDTVVLEIRTYRLHPGTGQEFHRVFQEQCLPLLEEFGIRVARAGLSEVDEGGVRDYLLVRVFDDFAARDEQEASFYGSAHWREGPREPVMSRIESYHTVVLSVPREAVAALTAA